ncbi:class I SAM-dependent methyltransferase [Geomonas sp. RF6]|uniref:class I SAM-dependent methyltransferase n=1 Tax=Geomonas sp. RF6 TaxID=2897342 RepID=UPI001E561B08|nr:class I SAM-dependent methyltransferase [Geomonas sp. RF6]UFS69723.1 class I SAM-dependent methyltransferase [Geomonas sp. RF6]
MKERIRNICHHAARALLANPLMRERVLRVVLEPREAAARTLAQPGYLDDIGWFNAYEKGMPVGAENEPVPWLTYPAVSFLKERLHRDFDLFEYGCGNSTLFYADRVQSVSAVEHDRVWFERVQEGMAPNVRLIFSELEYGGGYCRTCLADGKRYDLIVVDGRDRVNCLAHAVQALKPAGVLILDDSQRESYLPGRKLVSEKGFRHIDFWGINPGCSSTSCTTFFYRQENCLGL